MNTESAPAPEPETGLIDAIESAQTTPETETRSIGETPPRRWSGTAIGRAAIQPTATDRGAG